MVRECPQPASRTGAEARCEKRPELRDEGGVASCLANDEEASDRPRRTRIVCLETPGQGVALSVERTQARTNVVEPVPDLREDGLPAFLAQQDDVGRPRSPRAWIKRNLCSSFPAAGAGEVDEAGLPSEMLDVPWWRRAWRALEIRDELLADCRRGKGPRLEAGAGTQPALELADARLGDSGRIGKVLLPHARARSRIPEPDAQPVGNDVGASAADRDLRAGALPSSNVRHSGGIIANRRYPRLTPDRAFPGAPRSDPIAGRSFTGRIRTSVRRLRSNRHGKG
jgi:hypothetical protein